jgi:hypothetical protein
MSRRGFRRISGDRSVLTTVRDGGLLRRVEVRGAGIRSIRGIERMQLLDGVTLSGLESPELELLTELPRLKALELGRLRGDVWTSRLANRSRSSGGAVSMPRRWWETTLSA